MSAGAVTRRGAGTAQPAPGRPATPPAPPLPDRPRLADGVSLVGPMRESAFADPPWLIDRDGVGYLQVSRLLYRIAELADGSRTCEDIAETITREGEPVQAETIARNLGGLLIPTGVVVDGAGEVARPAARPQSPLALTGRMKMLGAGAIEPLTGILKLLFWPPLAIAILVAAAATRWWLYFVHGVAGPARDVIDHPIDLLVVFALIVLSAGFHEFGHAAALRYGGGRVRGMGVGLYMVYPAVYTDVTENYRLPRWARIRTDLGGFHFNLVFSLAVFALAVALRQPFLLVFLLLTDLEILQQSLPFVRFDGYWALADLTGIPDFFTHMGVFWRRLLRLPVPAGRQLPKLKPWGTAVLAIYSIVTVPVLLIFLVLFIAALPRVLATAWLSASHQLAYGSGAWAHHDVAGVLLTGVQLLLLAFPAAAAVFMLARTFKQFQARLWRWAGTSSSRRGAAAAMTAASLGLCGFLWAPALPHFGRGPAAANWTPLAPGERGTVADLATGGGRSLVNPAAAPSPNTTTNSSGPAGGGGSTTSSPAPAPSANTYASPTPSVVPSPSGTP